jgi:hypothetical protein
MNSIAFITLVFPQCDVRLALVHIADNVNNHIAFLRMVSRKNARSGLCRADPSNVVASNRHECCAASRLVAESPNRANQFRPIRPRALSAALLK